MLTDVQLIQPTRKYKAVVSLQGSEAEFNKILDFFESCDVDWEKKDLSVIDDFIDELKYAVRALREYNRVAVS